MADCLQEEKTHHRYTMYNVILLNSTQLLYSACIVCLQEAPDRSGTHNLFYEFQ